MKQPKRRNEKRMRMSSNRREMNRVERVIESMRNESQKKTYNKPVE
jgi:hypothetical protein